MRDYAKLAAIKSELSKLREQHAEDIRDATFMGWTPEKLKAFECREDQIANLISKLAGTETE